MALTPKQQRFVAEYVKDLNATQAAIRAGYSAKTAKQIGSRLLTNVDVAAAVAAKQGKIAEKLEITAEALIRDVAEIGDMAKRDGVYASALKSRDMLGRVLRDANPFGERVEQKITLETTETTPLELARGLAFVLALAQREAKTASAAPAAPPIKH
jgi:hypothetical protein